MSRQLSCSPQSTILLTLLCSQTARGYSGLTEGTVGAHAIEGDPSGIYDAAGEWTVTSSTVAAWLIQRKTNQMQRHGITASSSSQVYSQLSSAEAMSEDKWLSDVHSKPDCLYRWASWTPSLALGVLSREEVPELFQEASCVVRSLARTEGVVWQKPLNGWRGDRDRRLHLCDV